MSQSQKSAITPAVPPSTALSLWDRRVQELLDFRTVYGHVNVPRYWVENPRLSNWVSNQRRLLRLGLLPEPRRARLAALGIAWESAEARREQQQEAWDRMFGALRAFKRSTGHLEVPRGWPVEPALAAWLASQRFLWRNGQLPASRTERLHELDAEWHRSRAAAERAPKAPRNQGRRNAAWERRFLALKKYFDEHGDCAVPARWDADPELGQWAVRQRVLRRRGRLSADRFERLDALGFAWSGEDCEQSRLDRAWERWFASLSSFVRTHGHTRVPQQDRAKGRLAAWVFRQRNERRRGTLSDDRIRRLDGLDFEWNPRRDAGVGREERWEKHFAELSGYRARHGSVVVPDARPHRRLHQWLNGQRRRRRSGRLSAPHARRLEALGVVWSPREDRWERRFAELLQYRKAHGHCDVPTTGAAGSALARWVSAQRTAHKDGTLSGPRKSRLEAAGFHWQASGKN